MTFEEFLEEKNLTPENTPGSEHALMQEAYGAGYEDGNNKMIGDYNKLVEKFNELMIKYNKMVQLLKIESNKNSDLIRENKRLEKNVIEWHKINLNGNSDNDGLPEEVNKNYLVLFKNGNIRLKTIRRGSFGCFSRNIEAWAELPEVKNADISS